MPSPEEGRRGQPYGQRALLHDTEADHADSVFHRAVFVLVPSASGHCTAARGAFQWHWHVHYCR